MRFSIGLALAAALLGVDACKEHKHPIPSGAAPSSAAATAVSSLIPTTSPTATTLSTQTRAVSVSSTSSAVAAVATTATSSSSLTTDQQNALDAQNSARSDVGTAALTWDADLASEAQTYAEHLVSVGELVHSGITTEGENLFMGYTSTPLADAANDWITSEKSKYSGQAITESNYMNFGHYTQIVWSTTTKVGMGSASGSDGSVYVVARYTPPGNIIGEAAY
ncbi:PR-1-like protein [Viridothelium virens]|uniref:PR-1-like protein n=1 Tax=Viridothelium virens TaxID=1048519 RepID=A0A6A6H686_VIRVR|nr:PR-1-like protein [Viridothelium virens]